MNKETITKELKYKAVRSSGAGGQNVNKVSTKVELRFDLANSAGLDEEEKEWLFQKITSKLSQDNIWVLSCDEDRSQLKNKELVTARFFEALEKSLKKPKARKPTKTPKAVIEKRLQNKKNISEIKETRRKPKL